MARAVKVEIIGDAKPFRRDVTRAQIMVQRSAWRRLMLRVALWRLERA